jgi:uncharacterized membrane protein
MGQDPNQPYNPNPYGQQPSSGGYPPQEGGYYQGGGYSQQPPSQPSQPGYPPQGGYQQPYQQTYQQPQPGPGFQQPYGQAPGAQGPYNTTHALGATTINMEPNVAGGLSYFTWVAGLIFFLIEKQNRFVRFNAMQSLLLTAAAVIVYVVLTIFSTFGLVGLIVLPVELIVNLGFFAVWLICVINAFQGKYFKLPFIGDYAERWANPGGMGTPLR